MSFLRALFGAFLSLQIASAALANSDVPSGTKLAMKLGAGSLLTKCRAIEVMGEPDWIVTNPPENWSYGLIVGHLTWVWENDNCTPVRLAFRENGSVHLRDRGGHICAESRADILDQYPTNESLTKVEDLPDC